MDELLEYLDSQSIQHDLVGKTTIDIDGFGLAMFADFENKKSIFRTVTIGDKEQIHLNIFQTKEELFESGIKYIVFKFGGEWNYIDINADEFDFKPLVNVGMSYLPYSDYDYINLGCHTGMELLNGSANPDRWVERAKFLGHKYIGICDFNTLGNTLNLQKACDKYGINPIFGYSTKIDIGNESGIDIKIYATNNNGFNNLLRIHKNVAVDKENGMVDLQELIKYSKDCYLVIGKFHAEWIILNQNTINKLKGGFKNVFFQIDVNEYKANRLDVEVLNSFKCYYTQIYESDKHIDPILLTDCYYVNKIESKNKVLLNKISLGAAHNQSDEQWYKTIDEHISTITPLFDEFKWDINSIIKECADNTLKVAESCTARYKMDTNYMPRYDMTEEEKVKYGNFENMFDQLLEDGFKQRVPKGKEKEYRERLEMEKYVIKSTNNVDYMLVQRDTVNYAKESDILTGAGRGSAGGSLILYLLGITHVDPIRFSLLFERFLLPERAGLYEAQVTKVIEQVSDSDDVVEIEFEDGRKIVLDPDSQIVVDGEERAVYADELKSDMDINFDNIDNLFKIK